MSRYHDNNIETTGNAVEALLIPLMPNDQDRMRFMDALTEMMKAHAEAAAQDALDRHTGSGDYTRY